MLEQDISKIIATREQLHEATVRLGKQLTEEYHDKNVLMICLLRGAALFMSDLVREMDCHVEMDFMDVSSYHGGTSSSGQVKILKDLDTPVEGRHLVIVEDIIDTGRTLKSVIELLKHRQAASVKVCAIVDKPEARVIKDVQADFVGLEVPNEFLVGYGLDYQEKYRNLPYIGVLKPEVYTEAT